jgi:hypothetical protein
MKFEIMEYGSGFYVKSKDHWMSKDLNFFYNRRLVEPFATEEEAELAFNVYKKLYLARYGRVVKILEL